jgi:HEAT repeat protein
MRSALEEALGALRAAQRPAERARAAAHLYQLAGDDAAHRAPGLVLALPSLLSDEQADVRRAGVRLAARLLEEDALAALLSARLSDADVGVRLEAAGQLADLTRSADRDALSRALADPQPQVRFEAARGLAALGDGAGLPALLEALESGALRFRALGALAQLGDARALPAVQRLFARWLLPAFERTQAAGALARLGDPAGARHLLGRLERGWTVDRALALELLGEVKAPGALARLRVALEDPREPCRGAAARGLGRLGEREAQPWLASLLEDTGAPEDVRLDAAEGLCQLGGSEARERVARALDTFASAEARAELAQLLEETP